MLIIEELISKDSNLKPLGMDHDHPPDKLWLIKTIFALKPDHEIFTDPATKIIKLPIE